MSLQAPSCDRAVESRPHSGETTEGQPYRLLLQLAEAEGAHRSWSDDQSRHHRGGNYRRKTSALAHACGRETTLLHPFFMTSTPLRGVGSSKARCAPMLFAAKRCLAIEPSDDHLVAQCTVCRRILYPPINEPTRYRHGSRIQTKLGATLWLVTFSRGLDRVCLEGWFVGFAPPQTERFPDEEALLAALVTAPSMW